MRGVSHAIAALLLVVACGSVANPGNAETSPPPTAALSAWQGFPANKLPRLIVLLGNDSRGGQGFASSDAWIAGLCGKFALSGSLPSEVLGQAVASWPDGTTVTYPAASAADTFAAMSYSRPGASAADCSRVAPLQVTAARFGTARFQTDRGRVGISVWIFTVAGVGAAFPYPAVAPSAVWKGGLVGGSTAGGVTISPDGRTLRYWFTGAPDSPGPCGADYKAAVAESAPAVAISIQKIPHASPSGPVACTMVAQHRSVMVTLASRLGGRVVVDEAGAAVAVCPEALKESC